MNVMDHELPDSPQLFKSLAEKAGLKLRVQDQAEKVFREIKSLLPELALDYREIMAGLDSRILPDYRDRSQTEAELHIAGDVLVFSLLNGVFEFDRNHPVWKNSFASTNPEATYCGVVNIFNFLSDSFRFNRMEDPGYLIARIFINAEGHFFVEGKRQTAYLSASFGTKILEKDDLRRIIQTSVNYAMSFDLLVPPYDDVKIITVEMIRQKMESSKSKTGKRLGFQFNSDDIR